MLRHLPLEPAFPKMKWSPQKVSSNSMMVLLYTFQKQGIDSDHHANTSLHVISELRLPFHIMKYELEHDRKYSLLFKHSFTSFVLLSPSLLHLILLCDSPLLSVQLENL